MTKYGLIENLRGRAQGSRARAVMFDFDGTITLIRAGWLPLMLDMMMETLAPLGDAALLRETAEQYVARHTGRDTVHQMQAFADHVTELGGSARPAIDYKAEFISRIDVESGRRLKALQLGDISADDLMVPGTRKLLAELAAAGLRIFLASGTAHEIVTAEAKLLGIEGYFEAIHGSAPSRLTKRALLDDLLASGVAPEEILTFGDGQVEIIDTKAIGGTAVGVATDEPDCRAVNAKKRSWLVEAGADFIIPNFEDPGLLRVVAGLE